jgi:hypothetical protein
MEPGKELKVAVINSVASETNDFGKSERIAE